MPALLLIKMGLRFILLYISELTRVHRRLPTFHQREQATLSVYSICYRKSNDIHGKCKTSFRFLGAVAIIMPQSSQKQSFHAIGEPMESQLCFL